MIVRIQKKPADHYPSGFFSVTGSLLFFGGHPALGAVGSIRSIVIVEHLLALSILNDNDNLHVFRETLRTQSCFLGFSNDS